MKPINIGTRGYLDSPLSIATMGHLSIELVILTPTRVIHKPSFVRSMSEEVERKVYLKRNPKLVKEEDEMMLILQSFLVCQS